MRIVFRADASDTIGTGHVVRCLTLADDLRANGADVSFVCREYPGHLAGRIEAQGFPVSQLVSADATWSDDASQTRRALESAGGRADWLVVDHYGIDERWERAVRRSTDRVMVIDDLPGRTHDCDLLLDQNLTADMQTRHAGTVPEAATILAGPEFALLHPAYADLHDRTAPRAGPIRRILISFGGWDSQNLTGRALAAFLSRRRPGIDVDVVIDDRSPHAAMVRRQALGHSNIHVHGTMPTLAPLIASADLGVGAGGATTWERLCLGLPTLVITAADNQRPIAEWLHQCQLVHWLGHHDTVTDTRLAEALHVLIEAGGDQCWSDRCAAAVDGRGVARVTSALTIDEHAPLRARHANPGDEATILTWANDPTTRRNALSPEPIPADTHRTWFRARLGDVSGARFYVVETSQGVPVGQTRFSREPEAWEVHFAVAPMFRGRGLGRRVLQVGLDTFRADVRGAAVFGRVKPDNARSRRVFESLGFETGPPRGEANEVLVYRLAGS